MDRKPKFSLGRGESGRFCETFCPDAHLSTLLVLTVDSLLFLAHIWSRLYDNVRLLTVPFGLLSVSSNRHKQKMKMRQFETLSPLIFRVVARVVLSEGLPTMRNPVSSQERSRPETGSRLVQTYENQLDNLEDSATENRQILVQAFGKGQTRHLRVGLPSLSTSLKSALFVLAITMLAFSGGCDKGKTAEAAPPVVEVVDVTQKDVPITSQWVATLTGKVNAQIRAQVAGYLMQQIYSNGAYVRKGTPLFQLDPRTFQASLDQAKGVLQQANGDLARAQAQQGKTQMDVARYTPLAQQGAISKQELDDAVQNNLSALAQVEAAKAAVASAQAALETSKLNLGFSTIVAPIDGVAGIANAQVGDFISPQSTNPLTTISTINPILANFTPSEREYLKAMRNIEKAGETEKQALGRLNWQLELTDGSIYPLNGKFYALDRQVDISTGAILLQVEFPNPNNLLRPGGFGNIRTVGRIVTGALLVPQRAVTDVQGKYLIAVVGSDNKVNIRPVVVGEKFGEMWIITDGLKPGDRVVAEGTTKVSDGIHVIPKPYSPGTTTSANSSAGTPN
jgi:membrane fusion protein, multidrug efflux system